MPTEIDKPLALGDHWSRNEIDEMFVSGAGSAICFVG